MGSFFSFGDHESILAKDPPSGDPIQAPDMGIPMKYGPPPPAYNQAYNQQPPNYNYPEASYYKPNPGH